MKTKLCLIFSLFCSTYASAGLDIDQGYVRAVPPGKMMSAAFMHLSNNTGQTITLIGGTSPNVKAIEVHNHSMVNGVMKMVRIPGLSIEPGKTVILKPGGLHLMLIGLKRKLNKGESFSFNLQFKNIPAQSIDLPVKSLIAP
ncbi:MAG: hypothetical protein OFPII_25460 [Osedax symbiont Rs1]|nr:MAG: hypothetical protein OFPII_25460 [Osedax symbiont Rs1]